MKIFITIFLAFIMLIHSYSQDEKTISDLQPLMKVLEISAFTGLIWQLAYEYSDSEQKPKMKEEVINDIKNWLMKKPDKDERIAEYILAKKYENNIINLFNEFSPIGSQFGGFLYLKSDIPVRFASKDSGITLLVTGIASENTYNTLRSTAKQRAAKVISSMILPSIDKIVKIFINTEVKFIGMVVTYGSKDFSDDSKALNLIAETVALVSPIEACKNFIEGKITEDELLNESDVYQCNRDMRKGMIKIKIEIE